MGQVVGIPKLLPACICFSSAWAEPENSATPEGSTVQLCGERRPSCARLRVGHRGESSPTAVAPRIVPRAGISWVLFALARSAMIRWAPTGIFRSWSPKMNQLGTCFQSGSFVDGSDSAASRLSPATASNAGIIARLGALRDGLKPERWHLWARHCFRRCGGLCGQLRRFPAALPHGARLGRDRGPAWNGPERWASPRRAGRACHRSARLRSSADRAGQWSGRLWLGHRSTGLPEIQNAPGRRPSPVRRQRSDYRNGAQTSPHTIPGKPAARKWFAPSSGWNPVCLRPDAYPMSWSQAAATRSGAWSSSTASV